MLPFPSGSKMALRGQLSYWPLLYLNFWYFVEHKLRLHWFWCFQNCNCIYIWFDYWAFRSLLDLCTCGLSCLTLARGCPAIPRSQIRTTEDPRTVSSSSCWRVESVPLPSFPPGLRQACAAVSAMRCPSQNNARQQIKDVWAGRKKRKEKA